MKTLKHENVVRLYEVIDAPDANKVYLVMEYLSGGEIHYAVCNREPLGRGGEFGSPGARFLAPHRIVRSLTRLMSVPNPPPLLSPCLALSLDSK